MGDENLFSAGPGTVRHEELMRLAKKFDEGCDHKAMQEMMAREEEDMKKYGMEYWECHPEERTKQEGNCSESTSGSVTVSDSSPPEKAQLKNSPKPETAPGKPQK